jgi:hypothetical protein
MPDYRKALVDNHDRNSFAKTPIIFSHGKDECITEPMRIQVTVYSLQGICRRNLNRRGKYPEIIADTSKNLDFTPPITALISVRGEVVHTLAPSIPLKFNEGRKGHDFVCGSAFWQSNIISAESTNGDDVSSSTFELKRVMKRQCFQPNSRIGHISHYQPERVDFVVGVGKGNDMYPLGIASIAISGEEEAEHLTNAPIKSIYEKARMKQGNKCHSKGLFFDGESHSYGLWNNAILRVGVRVIPEHNYIPKTVGDFCNGSTVKKPRDSSKFIELNDENSLIAEFKEAQAQLQQDAVTPKNHEINPPVRFRFVALSKWPYHKHLHQNQKPLKLMTRQTRYRKRVFYPCVS